MDKIHDLNEFDCMDETKKIGWIDKMIEIEKLERIGMYFEPCKDEFDNLDNINEIHRTGMQLLFYIPECYSKSMVSSSPYK
jgi:hypothetical protein